MTASKARFPPRCISDWQESDIQSLACRMKHLLHQMVCSLSEASVTREEATHARCFHQIHVGSTPPVIESVPTASMLRCSAVDRHIPQREFVSWFNSPRLPVPGFVQPSLHWSRCVDWDVLGQRSQARERQVVGMCVRHQHRIESWQTLERDPGWAHALQESCQCWVEVRIRQDPCPIKLDEQRRVPDVRDPVARWITLLRDAREASC